ncbi:MAG TPA: glucose-1-phosphate adenylyltransferase [Dehalococcoidia bacterium]|nr:glucose-1-phosphate adenylyltransferase [Dehalococcoidia bacterium]
MDRVLVVILAGETKNRLQPLTNIRAKPAIPFGGGFRVIDFTLSNCINSGIRQMFVLTQYRSWSLQRHIQDGWGISSANLGEYVYCVPAQQKVGMDWYHGTADAIRQNLDLIDLDLVQGKEIEHVLILSGDHIYKMDYRQLLQYHMSRNADLTVSGLRVSAEQATGNLGVLSVEKDYKIVGFEENSENPKSIPDMPGYVLASMGIYVFKVDVMVDILHGEGNDFGRDIIPKMAEKNTNMFAYDFTAHNKIKDYVIESNASRRRKVLIDRIRDSIYWRNVDSLDSFYEANMELAFVDPVLNLYGELWPIRSYQRPRPPSKFVMGGSMSESLVSDGCIISGSMVRRSILSPGVIVEKEALVEDSVIFDDVIIGAGSKIRRAIIDKEAKILPGASLGYDREADKKRGCTISQNGIVVVPRDLTLE